MQSVEVESLWTRLRRRKVVQWGIAYAAGAWGLLQGLAYATTTFHLPAMLQPLATLGLLIGLPIVLVLAWYHGDRGQQRVTAAELAIITLLFLLGGGLFWRYDRTSKSETGAPTAGAATATSAQGAESAAPGNSIAVLPFVKAGRVRALAITSLKRSPLAPEYPTVAESGFPDFDVATWSGLYAPAAIARDLGMRISGDIAKAVRQPDVKERMANQGIDPVGSTPEEHLAYVKAEFVRIGRVAREANIRAD